MKDDLARHKAIGKLVETRLRAELKAGGAGCPEAEILAGYVERSLSRRERASFEVHLSTCARCQSGVAELVRLSEGESPAGAPIAAAPSPVASFFRFRWAWAGTALAALLIAGIWYSPEFQNALHQPRQAMSRPPLRAASPPTPSKAPPGEEKKAATPLSAEREGRRTALQKNKTAAASLDLVTPAAKTPEPQSQANLEAAATPNSAPAPLERMASTPATPMAPPRARQQFSNALSAGRAGERRGQAIGGLATPGAAVKVENALTPAPSPPPTATLAAESARKDKNQSAAAEELKLRNEAQTQDQARAKVAPSAKLAAATEAVEVEAQAKEPVASGPGGAFAKAMAPQAEAAMPSWRVGPRGLIQQVNSKGEWKTHKSGVRTDLNEISFATPDVGWVVGQAGTILLTTDGGTTWTKVPSPTSEDLTQVAAQSDSAATVVTRSGVAFSTTDGGKTWTTSQHQQ